MHDYTFSVTRNIESGFIAYPYRFEATVWLPAQEVWQQWITTLTDHRKSWLWPTRYSQPSIADGLPDKGGRIVMTYQIPNPYDSSRPDAHVSHEFDIIEFSESDMFLEYCTTDSHAFLKGGGAFKVKPVDGKTSALTWDGEYRHDTGDARTEAQGNAFPYYLCTFFTATAENIRKADRRGSA